MTSKTNVGVVGLGVAGLAVGFRLAERGCSVTMLGARQQPGTGSVAAQGISSTKGLLLADSALFKAKLKGHAKISGWLSAIEKASGMAISRLHGAYEPYFSAEEFQKIASRVFRRNFLGCYGAENLCRAKFFEKTGLDESLLVETTCGALFYPRDLWFHPSESMRAMERAIATRGGKFFEAVVLACTPHSNGGISVRTDRGELAFDEVVVAAGAGSETILRDSGTSPLRTSLVAGYVMNVRVPSVLEQSIVVKWGTSLAVSQNVLRFGSTSFSGSGNSDETKRANERELVGKLREFYGLDVESLGWNERETVFGVRVRSRDRAPLVGALPFPASPRRLFVVTALYKNGLQLADLCAQHVVAEMFGEPVPAATREFAVSRIL